MDIEGRGELRLTLISSAKLYLEFKFIYNIGCKLIPRQTRRSRKVSDINQI